MPTGNEDTGIQACLHDMQFRDMLLNHSGSGDRGYISDEMDRIGIVFKNDADHSKKNAVIDLIVEIKWSDLKDLEAALKRAEGQLQVFVG